MPMEIGWLCLVSVVSMAKQRSGPGSAESGLQTKQRHRIVNHGQSAASKLISEAGLNFKASNFLTAIPLCYQSCKFVDRKGQRKTHFKGTSKSLKQEGLSSFTSKTNMSSRYVCFGEKLIIGRTGKGCK